MACVIKMNWLILAVAGLIVIGLVLLMMLGEKVWKRISGSKG